MPTRKNPEGLVQTCHSRIASVIIKMFFVIFLCWVCTTFEMEANEMKPNEKHYIKVDLDMFGLFCLGSASTFPPIKSALLFGNTFLSV